MRKTARIIKEVVKKYSKEIPCSLKNIIRVIGSIINL